MTEPLGVAVVGLNVGKAHLWAYQQLPERFRVAAVCDIDGGRAERAAGRNPGSVALTDLAEGDTAIKYGTDIGRIVAAIRKGEHVHTHNLKTKRW